MIFDIYFKNVIIMRFIKKMSNDRIKIAAFIMFLAFMTLPNMVFSSEIQETNVSQVMSAGSLELSSDASSLFTPRTISANDQAANTSVDLSISDTRGSGAGWAVTMTATPLTTLVISGVISNAGTMTITAGDGRYNGFFDYIINDSPCIYTMNMIGSGVSGIAIYDLRINDEDNANCLVGEEADSVLTAANERTIGLRGITVDMSGAADIGDSFRIITDMYSVEDLSAVCNSPVALSGNTAQLSEGSCSSFVKGANATISNAQTVLTAPSGYGLGTFTQQIDYTLTIHKNTLAATYSGTLTFTIA